MVDFEKVAGITEYEKGRKGIMIKSLEEIKKIIEKFPEASGVGCVIAPQLIKIALKVGLIGYEVALGAWLKGDVFNEKVYVPGEKFDNVVGENLLSVFITYKGLGLRAINGVPTIGIKRTIEDIEEILKEIEPKKEIADAKV